MSDAQAKLDRKHKLVAAAARIWHEDEQQRVRISVHARGSGMPYWWHLRAGPTSRIPPDVQRTEELLMAMLYSDDPAVASAAWQALRSLDLSGSPAVDLAEAGSSRALQLVRERLAQGPLTEADLEAIAALLAEERQQEREQRQQELQQWKQQEPDVHEWRGKGEPRRHDRGFANRGRGRTIPGSGGRGGGQRARGFGGTRGAGASSAPEGLIVLSNGEMNVAVPSPLEFQPNDGADAGTAGNTDADEYAARLSRIFGGPLPGQVQSQAPPAAASASAGPSLLPPAVLSQALPLHGLVQSQAPPAAASGAPAPQLFAGMPVASAQQVLQTMYNTLASQASGGAGRGGGRGGGRSANGRGMGPRAKFQCGDADTVAQVNAPALRSPSGYTNRPLNPLQKVALVFHAQQARETLLRTMTAEAKEIARDFLAIMEDTSAVGASGGFHWIRDEAVELRKALAPAPAQPS